VRDVLLLQVSVDALADANQAVFVAGGNPQQLQFLPGLFGIGARMRIHLKGS
jgi:hypothetical protein